MLTSTKESVAPTGTKRPLWHWECACQRHLPEGQRRAICGHQLVGVKATEPVPPQDNCVVCEATERCPFCGYRIAKPR